MDARFWIKLGWQHWTEIYQIAETSKNGVFWLISRNFTCDCSPEFFGLDFGLADTDGSSTDCWLLEKFRLPPFWGWSLPPLWPVEADGSDWRQLGFESARPLGVLRVTRPGFDEFFLFFPLLPIFGVLDRRFLLQLYDPLLLVMAETFSSLHSNHKFVSMSPLWRTFSIDRNPTKCTAGCSSKSCWDQFCFVGQKIWFQSHQK